MKTIYDAIIVCTSTLLFWRKLWNKILGLILRNLEFFWKCNGFEFDFIRQNLNGIELYEIDEYAVLCWIQLSAIQLNVKIVFLRNIDVSNLCDY